MIAQLTFPSEADATVGGLANYNPYAPKPLTSTWLYEQLIVRNALTCEETPWLAEKATWEGGEKLTFDIRQGVKWSDGQPFTAKDVAFTFNLMKKYPALDKPGVWTVDLRSAGHHRHRRGQQGRLRLLRQRRPEVRRDHRARRSCPSTSTPRSATRRSTSTRRPSPPAPSRSAATTDASSCSSAGPTTGRPTRSRCRSSSSRASTTRRRPRSSCAPGQLDAYFGEIPNPEKTFVSADPENNHFYYAPNGMTVLTGNNEKKPFNDVKFREAISYAMNKEEISLKATYGVMKPASQTGLKLPSMEKLLPEKYAGQDTVMPYDLAKAGQLLDAAGYKKGRRRQAHEPRRLAARGQLHRAGRVHRLPGHRRRGRQGPQRPRRHLQGHRLHTRTRSTARRRPATTS